MPEAIIGKRVVFAALIVLATLSQSAERTLASEEEVLIGTFTLRSGEPKSAPEPRSPATVEAGTSADMLLGDAMAALGAGDARRAQRHLEVLIAQFPDSVEAEHARRYLAPIYQATGGKVVRPAAGAPASPAVDEGWSAQVRRGTPLEERFAAEVPDRIFFSEGSAELGMRARNVLATQARWLNLHSGVDLIIEGHADDPGSTEANKQLSLARAEAVRRRLIEEGVVESRITVIAKGRSDRVAICDDAECAVQNRRAVSIGVPSGAALSATEGPVNEVPAPSAELKGPQVPVRTAGGAPSQR